MESDKLGVRIKNGPGSGFAYQDKSTQFVRFIGKEGEYRGFFAYSFWGSNFLTDQTIPLSWTRI